MNTKYIIKRTYKSNPNYTYKNIERTLSIYGNLTHFENKEYVWEKTSNRKTSEIIKGLDIEIRLFKKSDEETYGMKK